MNSVNVTFTIVLEFNTRDVGLCYVATPVDDPTKHVLVESRHVTRDSVNKNNFTLECFHGLNGRINFPEIITHGWIGPRARSEASLRHAFHHKLYRMLRETMPVHEFIPERIFNSPTLKMVASIYRIMNNEDLLTNLRARKFMFYLERYRATLFVPSEQSSQTEAEKQTITFQTTRVLRYYPDERCVSVLFKLVGRDGNAASLGLVDKDSNQFNYLNIHRFFINERWYDLEGILNADAKAFNNAWSFVQNNDVEIITN